MRVTFPSRFFLGLGLAVMLSLAGSPYAQSLDNDALVRALQSGGYVLLMRHASSPAQPPDADTANADNPDRERQLDETGRRTATAMGIALRRLAIPIAGVESSPAYRTRETARLAGFSDIKISAFLGNQGMQNSSGSNTAQLRDSLSAAVPGANRLLITHSPNIAAAFPDLSPPVEQGEILVFDPQVSVTQPVSRISIDEWPDLK